MRKLIIHSLLTSLLVFQGFHSAAAPATNRIAVTVRGKGPDVVLIPGLASAGAVWDTTSTRLEGRFRLHIVQVAGFAGAPVGANAAGPVLQPTVDAVAEYIKASQLKSPKVIGHSMGGLMGMMLALQHPDRVGKLMIVDSMPFIGALFGVKDVAEATPRAESMRDGLIDGTQEAYAQGETNMMRMMVKSTTGQSLATAWAVGSDKSVVARALYDVMTTDLRPKVAAIKPPVTMLYPWDAMMGVPQTYCDERYGQAYAALKDKTLVRIDGSFHFIMLDQPEEFAKQVEAFLK